MEVTLRLAGNPGGSSSAGSRPRTKVTSLQTASLFTNRPTETPGQRLRELVSGKAGIWPQSAQINTHKGLRTVPGTQEALCPCWLLLLSLQ